MYRRKVKQITVVWLWLLALALTLVFSQTGPRPNLKEWFTSEERDKVQRARSLSDKLKVYNEVINRHILRVRQNAVDENGAELQASTQAVSEAIKSAWDEIERSPEKKKAKHLKKFEIALREDLQLLKSLQGRSSSEYRDYYAEPIQVAEKTRREILSIIFDEKSFVKKKNG